MTNDERYRKLMEIAFAAAYNAALKQPAKKPTLKGMSDLPVEQPFVCDLCHIVFGSRKALDCHLQDPHRKWELNEMDKRLLKALRISVQ